jgi:2-haloacid dehalogenase
VATVFFDVFGTLVDWYGGLVRETGSEGFAVAARDAMFAGIREIVGGEEPWVDLDEINRRATRRLLADATAERVESVVAAWRRLEPWPDVREGLTQLRERGHAVATLSNGSVALLTALAEHGGLTFDRIIGCDLFRTYKPAPETYRGALELMRVEPADAWMVASHPYDLASAVAQGMRAAFVHRPDEWGGHRQAEEPPREAELIASSLTELADKLPMP